MIRKRQDPYHFAASGSKISLAKTNPDLLCRIFGLFELRRKRYQKGASTKTNGGTEQDVTDLLDCIQDPDSELYQIESLIRIRIKMVWVRNLAPPASDTVPAQTVPVFRNKTKVTPVPKKKTH